MSDKTIFERIIAKEIPAKIVYEDENTLAFHDIAPIAPVHVLVIPKTKVVSIGDATEAHAKALSDVLLTCRKVAELMNVAKSGFRVVFNSGEQAGQTVFWLHAHVIGGRQLLHMA